MAARFSKGINFSKRTRQYRRYLDAPAGIQPVIWALEDWGRWSRTERRLVPEYVETLDMGYCRENFYITDDQGIRIERNIRSLKSMDKHDTMYQVIFLRYGVRDASNLFVAEHVRPKKISETRVRSVLSSAEYYLFGLMRSWLMPLYQAYQANEARKERLKTNILEITC